MNTMVDAIKNNGGSATGFLLNAVEPNSIEERVAAIEAFLHRLWREAEAIVD